MGIWSTLSSNKYIQDIYIYIYLRIHYKVTGRVSRCRKYSTMRRSNLSSSGHSFPWALGKRLCLSSRLTLQCIFTHVSYIIPIFTLPAILENTQKGKTSSSYFFASLVNSLRSATSRWLHTLPSFCSVRYRKSNFTLYAKQTSSSSSNIVPFRIANIFTQLTQLLLGLRRLTRLVNDEDIAPLEDVYYPESDDSYRNYQVLILGATGRIGNIITKKLLLRGYRVRVLVRNLYSSTLNAVGTGCTFAKGDVRELSSLYDAMENVDKVIWAVGASNSQETESVEFNGLQNVIKALHDSKFQQYGSEESAKVTLFKFDRKTDFESWKPVLDEFRSRLASVGLQKRPPKIEYMQNSKNNAVFTGKIFDPEGGTAEIASKIDRYNLEEFEGLIIRCIGDGKTYGLELRTRSGDNAQVEYLARFRTIPNKWLTIRLPFSKFVAVPKEGILRPVQVKEEIRLNDIYQLAISFVKTSKEEQDDGFYLAVDYIKAYRKQQEPEFIMISCTDVGKYLRPEKLKELEEDNPVVWKLRGEIALRNSGLTYCIIRSGKCVDRPGGLKPTIVDQEIIQDDKYISHADLADVVLHSLNNRKACNVTFNAYQSHEERQPSSHPSWTTADNISQSLEQLRANT